MDSAMATMIVSKLNRQLNIGLPSPLNTRHPYIDPVSLIKAIHKTLGLEGSSSAADRSFRIEGRFGLWRLDVICTCTELVLIIKCLVLLVSLLTTLAHPVQLELHPGYIYEGK